MDTTQDTLLENKVHGMPSDGITFLDDFNVVHATVRGRFLPARHGRPLVTQWLEFRNTACGFRILRSYGIPLERVCVVSLALAHGRGVNCLECLADAEPTKGPWERIDQREK